MIQFCLKPGRWNLFTINGLASVIAPQAYLRWFPEKVNKADAYSLLETDQAFNAVDAYNSSDRDQAINKA